MQRGTSRPLTEGNRVNAPIAGIVCPHDTQLSTKPPNACKRTPQLLNYYVLPAISALIMCYASFRTPKYGKISITKKLRGRTLLASFSSSRHIFWTFSTSSKGTQYGCLPLQSLGNWKYWRIVWRCCFTVESGKACSVSFTCRIVHGLPCDIFTTHWLSSWLSPVFITLRSPN